MMTMADPDDALRDAGLARAMLGAYEMIAQSDTERECARKARAAVVLLLAEVEANRTRVAQLQDRIELAWSEADYGARHGWDHQDTLDAVLYALAGPV